MKDAHALTKTNGMRKKVARTRKFLCYSLAFLLSISLLPAMPLMAFADEAEAPDIELVNEEQDFSSEEDLDGAFKSDESEGEDAAGTPEQEVPSNDEPVQPFEPDFNDEEQKTLQERDAADALEAEEANDLELLDAEGLAVTELSFEVLMQANAAMIEIKAQASGQLTVANQWDSTIVVSRNNGTGTQVAPWGKTTFSVNNGDTIRVIESNPGVTFRDWSGTNNPLVSGVKAAIAAMPAMSAFTTTSAGTAAGPNFFNAFNYEGTLASLPAGSLNTSKITTADRKFFASFNYKGSLSSLPAGSFKTSAITKAGMFFFQSFNESGALKSLPAGSFNLSGLTTLNAWSFSWFNAEGALTSLPVGSFDTSRLTTADGQGVFCYFNRKARLSTLPAGSFNTSKVTSVGNSFFSAFNSQGGITSLPAGSFDLSKVTKIGEEFLQSFCYSSPIASLPASFKLPQKPSTVGAKYCDSMFSYSSLTHGNRSVSLYFAAPARSAFFYTQITPDSPAMGATVKVNGQAAPKTYTVSYNANGGSGSVTSQKVTNGASFSTRANGFTRTGYTFTGWNTQANGSGTSWAASTTRTYTATSNTTVYAQWKKSTTGTKPKVTTTTASVHSGVVGVNYKKTIAASGTKPINWTRSSGSLPPGLKLSGAGVITGKPTKTGTYSFVVKAANSAGSTTKTFKITIGAVKITTAKDSVHAGITGISYKKTLAASGAKPITWKRVSGSLPPGLKLSSAGVISGKPTKQGTYTFKVRATNSHGNTEKTFTIKVNNPSISISYQTHVQSVGWQAFKKDGAMSGTSGKALRLEGIKINLQNNTGISGGISYSTHVQSIGWQKKVSLNTNGKSLKDVKGPMSGTSGRALRLEAITIELTGDLKKHYDIYYRVHAQKVGWMGWARNGQEAGTAGHAYRLEGIQIVLVPKVGGKKPGNTFKGITTPPSTKSFIKK